MGSGPSSPIAAGYRVLNVRADGPAANCTVFPDAIGARSPLRRHPKRGSLVPWLDYIVSINGVQCTPDGDELTQELNAVAAAAAASTSNNSSSSSSSQVNHSNHNASETTTSRQIHHSEKEGNPDDNGDDEDSGFNTVILEVYNIKRKALRTVQLCLELPHAALGCAVTWDDIQVLGESEPVLHVTEVETGSPAQDAGLSAEGNDYILGSADDGVFEDVEAFGNAAYNAAKTQQPLQLYVYRYTTDSIRLVNVHVPREGEAWGGGTRQGTGMGIEVAIGTIHELPAPCRETDGKNEFEVMVMMRGGGGSGGGGGGDDERSSEGGASIITSLPFSTFTNAAAAGGVVVGGEINGSSGTTNTTNNNNEKNNQTTITTATAMNTTPTPAVISTVTTATTTDAAIVTASTTSSTTSSSTAPLPFSTVPSSQASRMIAPPPSVNNIVPPPSVKFLLHTYGGIGGQQVFAPSSSNSANSSGGSNNGNSNNNNIYNGSGGRSTVVTPFG